MWGWRDNEFDDGEAARIRREENVICVSEVVWKLTFCHSCQTECGNVPDRAKCLQSARVLMSDVNYAAAHLVGTYRVDYR